MQYAKLYVISVFNNDAQHAVSQSLTEFQNILPLMGPLNSCHESPLEAITAIIEKKKIQIGKKKKKRDVHT